jgi:hypothetical protein
VDLILLVTVEEGPFGTGIQRIFSIKYELVTAPSSSISARLTPAKLRAVEAAIHSALTVVPTPVLMPYNAVRRCDEPGVGPDRIGGYEMGSGMITSKVKISSRALQRLLAGEITGADFIAAHGWETNKPTSLPNPFLSSMRSGRMIEAIKVEGRGDKDDDWIEFTFGAPDAAAAHFVVKNAAMRPTDR